MNMMSSIYDRLENDDLVSILWEMRETLFLKEALYYKESITRFESNGGFHLFIPNEDFIKFRDGYNRQDLINKILTIGYCNDCEKTECNCDDKSELEVFYCDDCGEDISTSECFVYDGVIEVNSATIDESKVICNECNLKLSEKY